MKTTKHNASLIDMIGWIGVVQILAAYALLSFGVIQAGYVFQILTLIGSLMVAIETWLKKDKQPAILNFIFAAIAFLAIIRLLAIK